MQQFIVPVNNEALSRALVAVSGQENAELILKAYKAIEEAMTFGYQQGTADAKADKESRASEVLQEAVQKHDAIYNEGYNNGLADTRGQFDAIASKSYDEGYDAGREFSETWKRDEQALFYDDGYVDGVSDARMCPEEADRYVAQLCAEDEDEDEAWDALDEAFEAEAEREDVIVLDRNDV
jgi:hypothetical protein